MPEPAGNVVRSTIRKRSRVIGAPVVFVKVRRTSQVPKVELLAGLLVESRTQFGANPPATQESSSDPTIVAPSLTLGELRFRGPGAPSRCPAPADVPLASTKMKSVALS